MKTLTITLTAVAMMMMVGCGGVEPGMEPNVATFENHPTETDAPPAVTLQPEQLVDRIQRPRILGAAPAVVNKPPLGTPGVSPDAPTGSRLAALPCPMGLTDCAGECVDLGFDPDNCGWCGIACAAADTCYKGRCVNWPAP